MYFENLIFKSKKMAKQQLVCTLCGYAGEAKQKARGNGLVEFILWWFFIIPGLLYSIWSRGGKGKSVCPKCGNDKMIPQDTPLGQKLMSEHPQAPRMTKEQEATQKANNAHNLKVVGIVLAIFFGIPIILGVIAGLTEEDNTNIQPAEQAAKEIIDVPTVEYKELKNYVKSGKTWRNIVIPPKTSREDLITLAKVLHSKDSKSYFHIFDDDAKFEEYMNWDINYGKVKDKDGKVKTIDKCSDVAYCQTLIQQEKYAFPFPKAWGDKHDIAIINEMFSGATPTWKLSTPLGEEISNL